MQLLLVEDDRQSAEIVIRLFEGLGHEVFHTTSGVQGLKMAQRKHFDAILLDFNLPDLDGSQICLVLRPVMKRLPIIALTAQDDPVTRKKAKLFGFSAFVAKPWNMLELISTVQQLTEDAMSQPRPVQKGLSD
jgi:two-component system OmpR family response regulator